MVWKMILHSERLTPPVSFKHFNSQLLEPNEPLLFRNAMHSSINTTGPVRALTTYQARVYCANNGSPSLLPLSYDFVDMVKDFRKPLSSTLGIIAFLHTIKLMISGQPVILKGVYLFGKLTSVQFTSNALTKHATTLSYARYTAALRTK